MSGKMKKKAKTRLEAKKVTTKEKLETEIQRTRKTILRRLQVMKESCNVNRDSNDSDRVLLQRRSSLRNSSKRNPTFSHTNVRNEDATRDNYMCYRCQHFLEIPRNLSGPFSNGMSTFVERCKEELSFVQAIICLKSVTASASQIPVEQLQQIFDRQWDIRGERHCEDNRTDIEQSPVNKGLVSVRTQGDMRNTFTTSTPLSISDMPYITPQRTISYNTRFEDTRGKLLSSTSINNPNHSAVESLILESSNCHIAAREKRKVESCTIPETDVESLLNESLDMFDSTPEHQCFEFEKDIERLVQSTSKSGIEQINKKIIESKDFLQKSYADIPNEGKSILPVRNQSVDSTFDLENNFIDFTSMRSQNLTDRVLDQRQSADGSPKSLIITQKNVSQMSNVNNDEYFEFLFNDNSPWQMSNTTTGNPHEDSAYSTSRYDIFNNDTVEAGSIAGNKRLSDTEHYYKLQPCKKKTIVDKTRKVSSSINGMLTFDGSPKSLITEKNISQLLDIYNDENVEFQIINSYDERMSDIISEDSEDAVAESNSDKCTRNIEHCYELHNSPCNETITREKMMASGSIIQGAVIPDTNIEHHYNLRDYNNRRISREKEVSSTIIGGSEERKSRRWNLLEKENGNENKMISVDSLNLTLESLHIEHVIIKSLKVILSTFCDKKMVEEYMMKEQLRNTRNYWKGSLEEEAVNAILNISDIFTTEKKPNICIKVIMIAITTALNEMLRAQLNKIYYTETSVWIYRVQIILEFCNSLPICVKITDYLITRLKSLQSVLINEKKIQRNTCVIINQLDLVFYALNITLRKYRTIIPIDQRSRSAEKMILHVADLWKIHYIDKELEYAGLDLDAAEKRWLNVLENSAVVFTKHFAVSQFAEKSFSLVHVLISQSSTRIT